MNLSAESLHSVRSNGVSTSVSKENIVDRARKIGKIQCFFHDFNCPPFVPQKSCLYSIVYV